MDFFFAIYRSLHVQHGDDTVDRLNYYHTSLILVMFAVLITGKQFVGSPIQCWVPAHFTDAMEKYTNSYCWVQNTWFSPFEQEIPKDIDERDQGQLTYYQWVPLFLCLQAFLFYLPCIFWRVASIHWGIGVASFLQLASKADRSEDPVVKDKIIRSIAVRFKGQMDRPTKSASSIIYLTAKLLFCCNLAFQFLLIHWFIDTKYLAFGIQLITDLIRGDNWKHSGLFPRVTLCDFEVRVLANLQRHTVQCVLPINMFNEKFFIFMWFWMCLLAILTVGSLLLWTVALFKPQSRSNFAHRYLPNGKRSVDQFTQNHLTPDGILLLRLISHNCGDFVVSELLTQLWSDYQQPDGLCFNPNRSYDHSEVHHQLLSPTVIEFNPRDKDLPRDKSKMALRSLSTILSKQSKQTDSEGKMLKAREITKDPSELLF